MNNYSNKNLIMALHDKVRYTQRKLCKSYSIVYLNFTICLIKNLVSKVKTQVADRKM